MSAVFESRTLGPTDRLVLLALADHAGDDGSCYPSIARLCQRTGLGERAVQKALKRLRDAGQITAKIGGGRGNSTLYTITLNPALETPFYKPSIRNPVYDDINPAFNALNPARDAPEPSITIIEPSDKKIEAKASRRSAEIDDCVLHFNATADRVGWSRVQKITPARKAALSQRISDCGGEDAWREAIDRAAMSPLLTGQIGRGWRADFDWLCKAANFTKLMEGNYDPRSDNPKPAAHQLGSGGTHDSMVAAFAYVAGREPH